MPPRHPKPPNHHIKPADRLALAITGLKTGKYTTVHDAATQNAVPESTLRARVKSAGSRFRRAGANNKTTRRNVKEFRLTRTEENTLSNWIIQVHEGGNPISPRLIQDMANTLLEKRGGTHGFRVTPEWVSGYIQFHPEFAALVGDLRKELESRGFRSLLDAPPEPKDLETALKSAEDVLHNATVLAKELNKFEQDLQEKLREVAVTGPELARAMAVDLEEWRDQLGKSLGSQIDSGREMFDGIVDSGWDGDTDTFVNGYQELLSIVSDTKRVQEEMRAEFGVKGPVEES